MADGGSDLRKHVDPSARRQGSSDRSPMHPQARNRNGSPAWERKGSNPTIAPATPVRSRLSSGRAKDEPVEKGASLPKFGDWDATDPSSADTYTVIFKKAADEKRGTVQQASTAKNEQELDKNTERSTSNKKWYCCFQPASAET